MAEHLYCELVFEALMRSRGFINKWPSDFRARRIIFLRFLTVSGDRDLFHKKSEDDIQS